MAQRFKPEPPQLDELQEIKFITNYVIQGCIPPFGALVEFSQEPAGDLFLLMFSLDMEDIVKDWLSPKGGRQRSPGRHGRKRPRRRVDLDPNALFGSRLRSNFDPWPGIKLPGARALFALDGAVERVAWTAAIVEGLTDVGFETFWGFIYNNPKFCPDMAILDMARPEGQTIVGVAPPSTPIGFTKELIKQGFYNASGFSFTCPDKPFVAASRTWVKALSTSGAQDVKLTITSQDRGVIAESYAANLDHEEALPLAVSANVEAGEYISLTRSVSSGSLFFIEPRLFGFSGPIL